MMLLHHMAPSKSLLSLWKCAVNVTNVGKLPFCHGQVRCNMGNLKAGCSYPLGNLIKKLVARICPVHAEMPVYVNHAICSPTSLDNNLSFFF